MKAAWYEREGEAHEVLTIGELPTPEPGPGEVRVQLTASGVNPSDVKTRRRPLSYPRVVPHSDGAGVIDMVGAGVPEARMGERVWTWNAQWLRPMGTAAEYVVLPQAQAVRLPDTVSFSEGACFGIPLLTAMRAVQLLDPAPGKTVLVTGAGSAVGHYVTQLAVLAGAAVIGTAGSADKAQHARDAGAVAVVDYKTEPVAERVRALTSGRGVDGVVDMDFSTTAGFLPQGLMAPHGVYVCYGSNTRADTAVSYNTVVRSSLSLHFFLVYDLQPTVRQALLQQAEGLLAAGALRHSVGACYPLEQTANAHVAVESGKMIGNVVVRLN